MKKHLLAVGFTLDANSVTVPAERALIAEEKYLENGVMGAFMASYRNGDSSWSMAENCGELEEGQRILKEMMDSGKADAWLAEREALRKKVGQATFVTVRKPLQTAKAPAASPSARTELPAEYLNLMNKKKVQGASATEMQTGGTEETVLYTGCDGKKHEYCPYNETSKTYDEWRAPLGVNVFLGSLARSGVEFKNQNVLDIGCGTGTFIRAVKEQVGLVG